MRFRGKSIRRKIVALLLVPLVSLTALWVFATVLTGREASHLLDASAVSEAIGDPVLDALDVIQQERRETLIYLADRRSSQALPALRQKRAATDKAVAKIKKKAATKDVRDNLRSDSGRRFDALTDGMDGLPALRRSVESGSVSRAQALDYYNRVVDPGFSFLTALHALNDVEVEREGRAFVGLVRATETLSREDALITSALTTGEVDTGEIRQLSDLVANRELYYEINLEALPAQERDIYRQFWRSPETAPLREAEERLIADGPVEKAGASDIREWQAAITPVLHELRQEIAASGERHQDRVAPSAYSVFVQAGIAGVLGFLALLVSVIVSVRIGRDLIRDLSRLRKEAHEVSGVRLPSVMRRLASGEQVDVETEAPRLEYDKDEIGQAGQALNTLQRAAVEAAVRQADMRRGVSEVFVNLARRNQVLLHRQLTLLDAMERRTEDTDELADLFRLDHLTTRMRRHAEGLVILSGAAPSRQWRKPIQLMDVVRAAVAEVEDYERIEVRRLPRIGVGGPAVADLTHLIAELLENATVFSPPHTGVQVHGERVANGFTLEIHDRGLGMAPEVLLDANLRLAETPEFELSDTDRLGLFVVSRLAQRQSVRVSLQPSPYGGTTAIVFIPAALLTEAPDTADSPDTDGSGFRVDRKSDGRLSALPKGPGPRPSGSRGGPKTSRTPGSRIPGPRTPGAQLPGSKGAGSRPPGRTNGSPLWDGPSERDDHADPLGFGAAGAGPLSDPDSLADLDLFPARDGAVAPDGTEGQDGGVFRARPRARRHATPDDQHPSQEERHQQALDPAPERIAGAVPLPRRTPPALVTDHGHRVDGPGPDRPAPAAEPAHSADPSGAYGAEAALPPIDGLPRRVRQANLAPQLRENTPAAKAPAQDSEQDVERDAEEVRNRMASMQRGWQRGRLTNAHEADDAARTTGAGPGQTAPRTTSEGDGR
ncbi:nitrate- and nitrite sensing domain-containing protein [Streptomyces sp. NPDC020965]|uniref:sensor histidine kinase n=1 Tax=Streptomyces sp. NPDC020965 TaxID=3365105 RepID=UPI0037BB6622